MKRRIKVMKSTSKYASAWGRRASRTKQKADILFLEMPEDILSK